MYWMKVVSSVYLMAPRIPVHKLDTVPLLMTLVSETIFVSVILKKYIYVLMGNVDITYCADHFTCLAQYEQTMDEVSLQLHTICVYTQTVEPL